MDNEQFEDGFINYPLEMTESSTSKESVYITNGIPGCYGTRIWIPKSSCNQFVVFSMSKLSIWGGSAAETA